MVRRTAGRYTGVVAATFPGKPLLPLATRIWNYVQSLANLALFVFVALKLTGVVAWSWWWVQAPVWATSTAVVPFRVDLPGTRARIWNHGQRLVLPALTVLKLTGVVAWSWWWVLTPLWITGLVAIPLLCLLVAMTWRDRRSRRLLGVYQGEE
jgi:hypothetical protein